MDLVSLPLLLQLAEKIVHSLAIDGVKKGATALWQSLQPDQGEKAANEAVAHFVEDFLLELKGFTRTSIEVEGYTQHLKQLLENQAAVAEIASWLKPDLDYVDLGSVQLIWEGLQLGTLPKIFWGKLAQTYFADLRKLVGRDDALRAGLVEALKMGPDVGFNQAGYREYLRTNCESLYLSAIDPSTYKFGIKLWSVFVAQSAREDDTQAPRGTGSQVRPTGPISSALEIIGRERLVVILGNPGSGKTSLLKSLIMRWVSESAVAKDDGRFPIWINLRDFGNENLNLLMYCQNGRTTFKLDARELQRRLRAGGVTLYLDGLDEIFDAKRRALVTTEIAAFAHEYENAKLVITSRIVGYQREPLDKAHFKHATLEDFDDEQIREFINKWHHVAEAEPEQRKHLQGQLEKALKESPPVRDLAGNPLLLTMMAILNRNQPLPRDKVELYAQASRVLLHDWEAHHLLGVDTFALWEKQAVLCRLASVMQQGSIGPAGNSIGQEELIDLFRKFFAERGVENAYDKAKALVKEMEERNFILCFLGANCFGFVHRTFLEYFCARWFVEEFHRNQSLTFDQLKHEVFGKHWKEESWHEVLRLISSMISAGNAERLILFLMEQDGGGDDFANLMLAAGCLSEVRDKKAIEKTSKVLWHKFVQEIIQPNAHFSSLSRNAVQEFARCWNNNGRDNETKGVLHQLFMGTSSSAIKMTVVEEVARHWRDDTTSMWLRELVNSDPFHDVRRTVLHELANGWKTDEIFQILRYRSMSDPDALTRLTALQRMAGDWPDHAETFEVLQECKDDGESLIRDFARQELLKSQRTKAVGLGR